MADLVPAVFRMFLIWAVLLAAPAPAAHAQETYRLDAAHARIGFAVSHLGLFQSDGQFQHFDSLLRIDPGKPDRTSISVDIDAASVTMPSAEAVAMLRSPAHLDVAAHPWIRFRSKSVSVVDERHFRIAGDLELRGIHGDVVLNATLTQRRRDPASNGDVADFDITGSVDRTAFGMVADRDFISDTVTLRISARLLFAALHDGP